MPRRPRQALRYIRECIKTGFRFKSRQCKLRCREAYLIPSDGAPDATTAWSRTDHRFFHQWVPGAFMWWVGGSQGNGHVAICGWRKGRIRTVDFPNVGRWNNTTVAALEKAWGEGKPGHIKYAGMSLDIDGVKVRRFPAIKRRWSHP